MHKYHTYWCFPATVSASILSVNPVKMNGFLLHALCNLDSVESLSNHIFHLACVSGSTKCAFRPSDSSLQSSVRHKATDRHQVRKQIRSQVSNAKASWSSTELYTYVSCDWLSPENLWGWTQPRGPFATTMAEGQSKLLLLNLLQFINMSHVLTFSVQRIV